MYLYIYIYIYIYIHIYIYIYIYIYIFFNHCLRADNVVAIRVTSQIYSARRDPDGRRKQYVSYTQTLNEDV